MSARLIINADDFGLTRGINRGIAELHQAGVLTSATLMANGPAFVDAVAIAHTLPTLGVGCHIVLVDGTPVSPPGQIPSLLGPDRKHFRPTLSTFVRDLFLGRIAENEITREASAQVQKLQCAGIDVTHIDTHKHTHTFPSVLNALLQRPAVRAVRVPYEPPFTRRLTHASLKRRLQLSLLHRYQASFLQRIGEVLTTDGTMGIAATGSLNAQTLHQLLTSLPDDGTYELCCHPGYHDADLEKVTTRLRHSREIERQALLAEIPKMLALPQPPELIHYGKLKQDIEAQR